MRNLGPHNISLACGCILVFNCTQYVVVIAGDSTTCWCMSLCLGEQTIINGGMDIQHSIVLQQTAQRRANTWAGSHPLAYNRCPGCGKNAWEGHNGPLCKDFWTSRKLNHHLVNPSSISSKDPRLTPQHGMQQKSGYYTGDERGWWWKITASSGPHTSWT